MFRRIQQLLLAFALVLLAGCATTIDPQVKSSIKTVRLDPVTVPAKPVVAMPGVAMAAVFGGALGAMAVQSGAGDAQSAYKAFQEKHVDIGAEFTRQLRTQLEQKGYRVVTGGQAADAKLVGIVNSYGLGVTSLTSEDRGVATTITVQLVRLSDGQVVYKTQKLNGSNKALMAKFKAAPPKRWFEDGAMVAEQHKLVLELVTEEAMKGL